jgi:urease gamma subunit
MLGALAKVAQRRKIQKAQAGYSSAKAAYDEAVDRGDTRDQGKTHAILMDATAALLSAERGKVSVRR